MDSASTSTSSTVIYRPELRSCVPSFTELPRLSLHCSMFPVQRSGPPPPSHLERSHSSAHVSPAREHERWPTRLVRHLSISGTSIVSFGSSSAPRSTRESTSLSPCNKRSSSSGYSHYDCSYTSESTSRPPRTPPDCASTPTSDISPSSTHSSRMNLRYILRLASRCNLASIVSSRINKRSSPSSQENRASSTTPFNSTPSSPRISPSPSIEGQDVFVQSLSPSPTSAKGDTNAWWCTPVANTKFVRKLPSALALPKCEARPTSTLFSASDPFARSTSTSTSVSTNGIQRDHQMEEHPCHRHRQRQRTKNCLPFDNPSLW